MSIPICLHINAPDSQFVFSPIAAIRSSHLWLLLLYFPAKPCNSSQKTFCSHLGLKHLYLYAVTISWTDLPNNGKSSITRSYVAWWYLDSLLQSGQNCFLVLDFIFITILSLNSLNVIYTQITNNIKIRIFFGTVAFGWKYYLWRNIFM